MTKPKSDDKIGLWTTTALVVGNMIGSGIFLLPATLATYGAISFLGWIASSLGAMALALLFSNLSRMMPDVSGGPYIYSRAGLGDFAGFLVAWGYWISIWCTNAAILVTFISYLSVFFPMLAESPFAAVGVGLMTVWLLTWVNTIGVKAAGRVQLITTVLKLLPLAAVTFVGLFYIDIANFTPFNKSGASPFSAITTTATLTLFAFLGMESATIPAANIHNPQKTIPRATIIGTWITIVVYVLGSVAVMGMIPAETLKTSHAPFADAAAAIWGEHARNWVAFGAVISTFGALNGWILLQGQIPLAAASDKIFPKVFGRVNEKGLPVVGIVVSSILISGLILMNFTKGLTDTFTFMILMSTLTSLVAYLFSAASFGLITLQHRFWRNESITKVALAVLAFAYSLWAVIGSGEETVFWGFVALMAGIPFYVWMKAANNQKDEP